MEVFERTAKRQQFVNVILNVVKRRAVKNQVCYKFGVHIPITYKEAINLNKENGNGLWDGTVHWELDQILSDKCF